MTLYRVSVLDHDCVDYVVHVCGNGAVWCIERIGLVQWYEHTDPKLYPVRTHGRITAEGTLLPLRNAGSIGVRYRLNEFELETILSRQERGPCGQITENVVESLIRRKKLHPTFGEFLRRATPREDIYKGVDMFAVSDVDANGSGIQVKWDGRAESSGNLFVQVWTESVGENWTEADSECT